MTQETPNTDQNDEDRGDLRCQECGHVQPATAVKRPRCQACKAQKMKPVTPLDDVSAPEGSADRVREDPIDLAAYREGATVSYATAIEATELESGVCVVCGCTQIAGCLLDDVLSEAGDPATCDWVKGTPTENTLCTSPECLAASGVQLVEGEDGSLTYLAPNYRSPAAPPAQAFATGYDAKGEAVDVPVMKPTPPATPTGEGQSTLLDGETMTMLRTGVWEPVDGYAPQSVELTFGGRVELSLNAHDRALAGQLRLNRKITIRAFVRVDGRTSKVMRKKGAFDGITVKVPLFVYGIGLVAREEGDDLGEETDELLLLNQVDTLQGKLESIGEAAGDLLAGKVTLNRLRAFVEQLTKLAPKPEDPDDGEGEDTPQETPEGEELTPLAEAMREASDALGDDQA